jgi:hypothetical protein
VPIILYTLVLTGCGYSLLAIWLYASGRNRLLAEPQTRGERAMRTLCLALAPTFFSLSLLLLLTPLEPSEILLTWLLVPLLAWPLRRAEKHIQSRAHRPAYASDGAPAPRPPTAPAD